MCIGQPPEQPAVDTPAPTPAAASPTAVPQPIGGPRAAQNTAAYGAPTPNLRRPDRSIASGGLATGSGLFMP